MKLMILIFSTSLIVLVGIWLYFSKPRVVKTKARIVEIKDTVNHYKDKFYKIKCTTYQVYMSKPKNTRYRTAGGGIIDSVDPIKSRFCALSRDLLKVFKYGDTIAIFGGLHHGIWIVKDCTAKNFKGKPITRVVDLCMSKKDTFGMWPNCYITKYTN